MKCIVLFLCCLSQFYAAGTFFRVGSEYVNINRVEVSSLRENFKSLYTIHLDYEIETERRVFLQLNADLTLEYGHGRTVSEILLPLDSDKKNQSVTIVAPCHKKYAVSLSFAVYNENIWEFRDDGFVNYRDYYKILYAHPEAESSRQIIREFREKSTELMGYLDSVLEYNVPGEKQGKRHKTTLYEEIKPLLYENRAINTQGLFQVLED